ncbi:NuA4 histone H4 acetyltransferase complex and the SWR1 complex subunit [Sorochytrium milnesiophthora]
MAETANSSLSATARKKGIQLALPIVYGNHACYLPEDHPLRAGGHTHQWTVYVRSPYTTPAAFIQSVSAANRAGTDPTATATPPTDDNAGYFIRKVLFRLHESFENRLRVVDHPPFHVTETGWGEFEIQIQIHLQDYAERNVKVTHLLKLFRPDEEDNATVVFTGADENGTTLTVEHYDEVIVNEPTEQFCELALRNMHRQQQVQKRMVMAMMASNNNNADITSEWPWTPPQEAQEAQQLDRANTTILNEMQRYREMIAIRAKELQELKGEIMSMEAQ